MAEGEQCEKLEDVLYTSELWKPFGTVVIADGARFGEAWSTARVGKLADTLVASEAWDGFALSVLTDTLTIGEQWTPVGQPSATLRDTLHATDAWRIARSDTLADTLAMGEAWDTGRVERLADTLVPGEAWTPVRDAHVSLADTLQVGERWTGFRSMALTDAATLSDGMTSERAATLADVLVLDEAWSVAAQPTGWLRDAARFAERWTPLREPSAWLADEACLVEAWKPQGIGGNAAWTANTDTWGMSRYEDWPITSLAVVAGVLYGTAPDGLYRLDADDDAGAPIPAEFTTDLSDQGGEQPRHTRMVYAGAVTDGRLRAAVHHVTGRVAGTVHYEFEPRPADDFSPQRVKLGRGIKSRYLAFTIGNVLGSDFNIDSLSLIADATARRV